jgi:hypothetical protein
MSIEPVAWMDKYSPDRLYPVEFYNKYKDCEAGTAGFHLIKDLVPLYPQSALRELCLRVAMEVAQNYDGMTIEAIVDEVLAE